MKEHKNKKSKEEGTRKAKPRSPLNKQVFATMTGEADAVKLLADRIAGRDPEAKKPIYVQLDGDPALDGLRGSVDCVWTLCNTMDCVWEAGTALFGEANQTGKG